MILSLSSGLTTVRDAAPATPPAMKYDDSCGLSHCAAGFTLSFSRSAILAVDAERAGCCPGWTAAAGEAGGTVGGGDVMARFEPKDRMAFNGACAQSMYAAKAGVGCRGKKDRREKGAAAGQSDGDR